MILLINQLKSLQVNQIKKKRKIFVILFSKFVANANERGDIEFTVCELNCHTNHHDDVSPVHERKPRFSSLRKSGALGKAVRNKLNLSKSSSSTQSTEKQSIHGESSSFENERSESKDESVTKEIHEQSSAKPPIATKPPQPINKVAKKKSKLCLLL